MNALFEPLRVGNPSPAARPAMRLASFAPPIDAPATDAPGMAEAALAARRAAEDAAL
ncbi:hypothetical protein GXW79_20060, partial [Roseomonas arctica]|nr:hypothetical protein [Plastoroseomonas arctica]